MNKLKLLMIVMLVLLLVSCSGRSVKPLIKTPSNDVEIEAALSEDPHETGLNQDLTPAESSLEPIDDQELPTNDDHQSMDSFAKDPHVTVETTKQTVEPVPDERDVVAVPGEQVIVPTEAKPKDETPILIIQSENQYTDAEKAKLLREIDELLDETLKDITEGEVGEQLDNLVEGGQ